MRRIAYFGVLLVGLSGVVFSAMTANAPNSAAGGGASAAPIIDQAHAIPASSMVFSSTPRVRELPARSVGNLAVAPEVASAIEVALGKGGDCPSETEAMEAITTSVAEASLATVAPALARVRDDQLCANAAQAVARSRGAAEAAEAQTKGRGQSYIGDGHATGRDGGPGYTGG